MEVYAYFISMYIIICIGIYINMNTYINIHMLFPISVFCAWVLDVMRNWFGSINNGLRCCFSSLLVTSCFDAKQKVLGTSWCDDDLLSFHINLYSKKLLWDQNNGTFWTRVATQLFLTFSWSFDLQMGQWNVPDIQPAPLLHRSKAAGSRRFSGRVCACVRVFAHGDISPRGALLSPPPGRVHTEAALLQPTAEALM